MVIELIKGIYTGIQSEDIQCLPYGIYVVGHTLSPMWDIHCLPYMRYTGIYIYNIMHIWDIQLPRAHMGYILSPIWDIHTRLYRPETVSVENSYLLMFSTFTSSLIKPTSHRSTLLRVWSKRSFFM